MAKAQQGAESSTVDTALGTVEYVEHGEGAPVLFVHGTPGGCDQGALMTEFLVPKGFRTIALSRPGYLGTPLTDDNKTPDAQAALAGALMDTLGVERFALMCWSGGGPSSYRLAAREPDRVASLVAIAAVSSPFKLEGGEEKMLLGRFGKWLMKELVRHAPKDTVKSLVKEEGELSKDQVKELAEKIWDDPVKRQFGLDLMNAITGRERKAGFENDTDQFANLDLDLAAVSAPALLVHAKTDGDVPFEQSEHALAGLPKAELVPLDEGTHVSVWTDPASDDLQAQIVDHLRR